jgi:hypothetical protein
MNSLRTEEQPISMKEPDTSETTAMVNDHLSQDTFKQQQQQLFSELPSSCPPGAPSPYTLPTSYHDSSAYDYRSSPSLSRPETLGKFHPYDMGHYGVLPSTMLLLSVHQLLCHRRFQFMIPNWHQCLILTNGLILIDWNQCMSVIQFVHQRDF